MITLDSPQPTYEPPTTDSIPDVEDDKPVSGRPLGSIQELPAIIFGAATLSTIYNQQTNLDSPLPLRTVRLALRYGMRAFDTSPYYGASEIILGSLLKALQPEFPRESYTISTKVGRYGPTHEEFDYSPTTVRRSVERSLKRLNTTYLDTVFLHDIDFVCTPIYPRETSTGDHSTSLSDGTLAEEWGLAEHQASLIRGPGDQKVLDAYAELAKLKEEGIIKSIGISGYALPALLRIAILVLNTAPYQPLDIVMSFSHSNLQNAVFYDFLPAFKGRARIPRVLTASPLNMGLLTPSPPSWHPAPSAMVDLTKQIIQMDQVQQRPGGLPNVALGYAFRRAEGGGEEGSIPTVVGLSTLKEVHECVAVWREVVGGSGNQEERKSIEEVVRSSYRNAGWADYSWKCGF